MSQLVLESRQVARESGDYCLVSRSGQVIEPMVTATRDFAVDRVFAVENGTVQHNLLRMVKNHWTNNAFSTIKSAHTIYHFAYEFFAYTDWRKVVDKALTLRSDAPVSDSDHARVCAFINGSVQQLAATITGRDVILDVERLRGEDGHYEVTSGPVNAVGQFYVMIRHYLMLFNVLRYSTAGKSEQAQQVARHFALVQDLPLDVVMLAVSQQLGEQLPVLEYAEKVRLIQ